MGLITGMNGTELQNLRNVIRARMAALQDAEELGEAGQAVVTLDQQAVGRLSRMDALQNQAMAQAQHARRAQELKQLAAALLRMEDGEYGYCEDCGEEIALRRLELNPAAAKCISCASG
jgi:DnaK suppressor protein